MIIRQANYDDLRDIARVHAKCFPEYLSTRIGAGNDCYLLSRFYKEYLDDSPELFLVLEDEQKKIVGFCMGYYMDKTGQQARYMKNNRLKVYSRIAYLLVKRDRLAWAKMKMKFKKPEYVILNPILDGVPNTQIGDMLSVCVLPDLRGKGLSKQMSLQFIDNMKKAGRKYCLVSTNVNNMRAIHFYEKNGFQPWRTIGKSSITFAKKL